MYFYAFIYQWAQVAPLVLATVTIAVRSMSVQLSLWDPALSSSEAELLDLMVVLGSPGGGSGKKKP